jgi:hypothetical protein
MAERIAALAAAPIAVPTWVQEQALTLAPTLVLGRRSAIQDSARVVPLLLMKAQQRAREWAPQERPPAETAVPTVELIAVPAVVLTAAQPRAESSAVRLPVTAPRTVVPTVERTVGPIAALTEELTGAPTLVLVAARCAVATAERTAAGTVEPMVAPLLAVTAAQTVEPGAALQDPTVGQRVRELWPELAGSIQGPTAAPMEGLTAAPRQVMAQTASKEAHRAVPGLATAKVGAAAPGPKAVPGPVTTLTATRSHEMDVL